MPDRIERQAELNAPIARVWRAMADYREFGDWFGVKLNGPFVSGQPARGNITHPGYEHVVWEVMIAQMEEESVFSFRWHPYALDKTVDYSGERPTLVEFRLEEITGGTRLRLVESGFDGIPEERRAEAFQMHEGGWTQQMKNIESYLAK